MTDYCLENIQTYKSGKIHYYIIKSLTTDEKQKLTSKQVKEMLRNNHNIRGIKIVSNRIYIDRNKKYLKGTNNILDNLHIYVGNNLREITEINNRNKYRERYLVDSIEKYCYNNKANICVLHGIRRTGKTVAMLHTINRLINNGIKYDDIAFIDVSYTNINMDEFITVVNKLNQKYIFIDEATRINNFIQLANLLSDSIALTKRVILAGTDSLVLSSALKDTLYGRAEIIKSNIISFKEHQYIFGMKECLNVKDKLDAVFSYMSYGGTTYEQQYFTDNSTYDMVNTAIIGNIINTINRNKQTEYKDLKGLTNNQIAYIIYCYIVLTDCSKSTKSMSNVNVKITDNVNKVLHSVLGSEDIGDMNSKGIKAIHKEAILKALRDMDILFTIRNIISNDIVDLGIRNNTDIEMCCMIPGLYYSIVSAVNNSNYITKNEDMGSILENLVLQQCVAWLYSDKNKMTKYKVKYVRYNTDTGTPEIDVLIHNISNKLTNECTKYSLIEVKLSNQIDSKQYKNFKEPTILKLFGYNTNKIIVYTGETTIKSYSINGIEQKVKYINIYDFIIDIDKWLI